MKRRLMNMVHHQSCESKTCPAAGLGVSACRGDLTAETKHSATVSSYVHVHGVSNN